MSPRLTKNSRARAILKEKLENGDITGNEPPKQVWASNPIFKVHTLDAFRRCYNNVKQELGISGSEIDEIIEPLNRTCTDDDKSIRRRKIDVAEAKFEEKSQVTPNIQAPPDDHTLIPLYLLSEWQEPRTTKRFSISIVVPSGVGPGQFKLGIVDEGDCLELTVDWPTPLTNIFMMHMKWLTTGLADAHPKILGFESAMRSLRINRSETVRSTARIGLPFTVQSNLDEQYNIAWQNDTTRMVYVDFKAVLDDYEIVNYTQEFEVV